jgi:hypothetical protein
MAPVTESSFRRSIPGGIQNLIQKRPDAAQINFSIYAGADFRAKASAILLSNSPQKGARGQSLSCIEGARAPFAG